jgi:hypothetical protein
MVIPVITSLVTEILPVEVLVKEIYEKGHPME